MVIWGNRGKLKGPSIENGNVLAKTEGPVRDVNNNYIDISMG
jgi:hypothetical protein